MPMDKALHAAFATAAVLAMVGSSASAAADDGLRWESDITYSADVDQGSLQLSSEMNFTNLTPNTQEGNVITRHFFTGVQFFVPDTARNISATSGMRQLEVTLERIDDPEFEGALRAEIDFGRNLLFEQSIEVTIEYEIPGDRPRSETTFRVNPAYLSFGVWGWGDPGLVNVSIEVPATFEIDLGDRSYTTTAQNDRFIYSVSDIEDVDNFYIYVQARNDDALTSEQAVPKSFDIEVRSWPDDIQWSRDVLHAIEVGLPELQRLIAQEWPHQKTLRIIESQQVTLAGYGGWYLSGERKIEIGEWVDPHLVMHELSHTWLNHGLFRERWIVEGLAEEYAALAVFSAGLGDSSDARPQQVPFKADDSVWLNDWVVPDSDRADFQTYEEYGYTTSFWVIQELVSEIGPAAMAAVIHAAATDLIAYQSGPDPEQVSPSDDWRRFLDLVEEVGGSERVEALFEQYVTESDLVERARARASYETLNAAAIGWKAPYYIRAPMGEWDFAVAEERIVEANAIVAMADGIAEAAERLSVVAPTSLESAYELADNDLEDALTLAGAQLEVVEDLVAARNTVEADRNLWETIGLIGASPDEDLNRAKAAFAADRLEDARSETDALLAYVKNAEMAGQVRAAVLGAALLLGAGGLARRQRGASVDVADNATPAT
jgi:hypothetical protein